MITSEVGIQKRLVTSFVLALIFLLGTVFSSYVGETNIIIICCTGILLMYMDVLYWQRILRDKHET